MTTPERDRYTISLRIRAPKALTEALERAAQASLTTELEYVRQAILARLKAEQKSLPHAGPTATASIEVA